MFNILKKNNIDYMVVGLGNLGLIYQNTKHNLGFIVIDHLAQKYDININKQKFEALYSKIKVENKNIILLKPQTFMNNSGIAVFNVAKYFKVLPRQIIVIHDDINLTVGTFKLKQGGSAGGHNGIKSIINFLDSQEFIKIKCGIGKNPNKNYNLTDWVLSKFTIEEIKIMDSMLPVVLGAICCIIKNGVGKAMNEYNKFRRII